MKSAFIAIAKWGAIGFTLYTLGAAYGPKTPVVKQAARALPKSAVL